MLLWIFGEESYLGFYPRQEVDMYGIVCDELLATEILYC